MSGEAIASTINSVLDFAEAHPFQATLALLGGFLGLVVGFFVFIGIPFAIGSTVLEATGERDSGFFLSWLLGVAFSAGILLVIALMIGFVRFVWYAWA
jgi:ABC-type antimicrobial peptide transport system permease subunit